MTASPGPRAAAPLRDLCLRQPGAVLEHPFGADHDVFKVGGRIFAIATVGVPPRRLTVKAEPERGAALRDQHRDITRGYHMNKRHWITLALDGPPAAGLVQEIVEDSYDLVRASLPRSRQPGLPAAHGK